jgi:hypothetical protein
MSLEPQPSAVRAMLCMALATGLTVAHAQADASKPMHVTIDNFTRAESDLYFGGLIKDSGGALGKFNHRREPARIDNQTVIRLNRDTLYSSALFDLEAGPVMITPVGDASIQSAACDSRCAKPLSGSAATHHMKV